jgi:beta-phosphoglucomutase-like phosphatase (HAD superfamily)
LKKIKAIIFDVDGVLIDSKEWHYEALNQALSLFGFTVSRYDHLVTFDGLPTTGKLEMLTAERGLPAGLHKYINALKQEYTMERIFLNCTPRFSHEYALSRLKAEGYTLAAASNSIRATMDIMLKKSNLIQYMEFSLSNQDVIKPKPDPEIYLKAIEKTGFEPGECLIIEDNKNGIAAAYASGGVVMEVKDAGEVNYHNIKQSIESAEA